MKITNVFLILLLIAATLLTHINTLDNKFVNWDDDSHVYKNPSICTITPSNIKHICSHSYVSLYLPVTMLSYMLDYQLWQLEPFGYHATNLFLHILNVILAFLLLNLILRNKTASFMAAIIFALHPVQVESVAWISERKNLLSTFFFFLSFIFYIKHKDRRKFLPYLCFITFFLLALLSKPSVVVLPLLLISYDYFYSPKINKMDLKDKIPFFLLTLVFCLTTLYFYKMHYFPKTETVKGLYYGNNFSINLLTMIPVFLNYLKLVFYPLNLCALYRPSVYTSIFQPKVVTSIILLVLMLFYLCFAIKKRHPSGFWILWFFILMLPVTNLIPIPTIYNDRYLYLSILSFPVLFYLILHPVLAERKVFRNITVLIFAIVVLSCGLLSYQRNKIWHNSVSFWSDVVKKAPTSHKAHNNLASSYAKRGLLDKAIEEYKESLAIKQNYAVAHNNLGLAYAIKGLLDKARKEWEIALEIDPELTQSRENLQRLDKITKEKNLIK